MNRFFMAIGTAALGLALAIPILADERHKEEMKACELVSIDRPFDEVANQVPAAIHGCGLILAGDIDWLKLSKTRPPHGSGSMPGEPPKLEGATTNVRTFLIVDEQLVKNVLEKPLHGFWLGEMVVFEKAGKTELAYIKPSMKIEELKKAGVVAPEKAEEHLKHAKEYEKKLEQCVNVLRGVKKS